MTDLQCHTLCDYVQVDNLKNLDRYPFHFTKNVYKCLKIYIHVYINKQGYNKKYVYPLPSSTLEPHQISLICSVEGGRGYIEGGIHILIVTIPAVNTSPLS